MPTESEKRAVINTMRAADHGIEAVKGSLSVVVALLSAHNWDSAHAGRDAFRAVLAAQRSLDVLHQRIYDEAIDRQERIPDDGVITPMSGGGSKGGGG